MTGLTTNINHLVDAACMSLARHSLTSDDGPLIKIVNDNGFIGAKITTKNTKGVAMKITVTKRGTEYSVWAHAYFTEETAANVLKELRDGGSTDEECIIHEEVTGDTADLLEKLTAFSDAQYGLEEIFTKIFNWGFQEGMKNRK